MEIIDINGKKRTIKDSYKIITDKRSNECGQIYHENIEGELISKKEISIVEIEEKFVEVTIIGKNRTWIEWYPLKQFEELNPDIRI